MKTLTAKQAAELNAKVRAAVLPCEICGAPGTGGTIDRIIRGKGSNTITKTPVGVRHRCKEHPHGTEVEDSPELAEHLAKESEQRS